MVFLSLELWRLKAQGGLLATRPLCPLPTVQKKWNWLCLGKGRWVDGGFLVFYVKFHINLISNLQT